MKIKLRTLYSGPRGNYYPGSVVDLPPDLGMSLVDGGFAVSLEAEVREVREHPARPIVGRRRKA